MWEARSERNEYNLILSILSCRNLNHNSFFFPPPLIIFPGNDRGFHFPLSLSLSLSLFPTFISFFTSLFSFRYCVIFCVSYLIIVVSPPARLSQV